MIAWIYSDPIRAVSVTGVTTSDQNFLEATKTVPDTSNHFGVVSDVVGDGSMISGRHIGVKQVPSRLAAPPRVSWPVIEQRGVSSVTNVVPEGFCDFVTRQQSRYWPAVPANSDARGGSMRCRESTPYTPRGLPE